MGGLVTRARTALNERFTRRWAPDAIPSRLAAPVVSFSFDDFPRSALDTGGAILKDHGARATYFAAGCFAGTRQDGLDYFDAADLARAAEDGHEIGCHTFGHLRLPTASRREIRETLDRNAAYVASVVPDLVMTSFAYPFGHASPSRKRWLGGAFSACRGIWPGVNRGAVDFAQLRATPLEMASFGRIDIDAHIDEAVRTNGWLVFFSHDISEAPTGFGYPTREFERVVRAVADRGVEILPIKNAAARVRFG